MDCRLDRHARTIAGRVEIDVENPSAVPLDRFYLWLYPNRFADVAQGIDDVNYYWLYPRRHDAGSMAIESAVIDGRAAVATPEPHAFAGERVLWSIALPTPVAPGAHVRVALSYRARLPERTGAFGCVDGQCTFAGGFYPMPAALDAAGWDLLAPPLEADTTVSVALDAPASIVLFDQWSGNGALALRARAPAARYATLVVAPEHHASTRHVHGATLRVLAREPPPPADDAERAILAYTIEDRAAHALDTAAEAAGVLHDLGVRPPSVTMVVAPLRFELAAPHGAVVLLSDRFDRIWPAERFRKFHRRQLARAVFAHALSRRRDPVAARAGALDRDESADLAATWLTELFVLRRYQRAEYLSSILKPVSFVPSIDELLYASQTMFADAYFGDGASGAAARLPGGPWRDDPRLFTHARPPGRFVYEKLRDLLSPAALARAMRGVVTRGAPVADAAAAAHGASLAWFFDQWTRPAPPLDVSLVGHRARPRPGGGVTNEVVVARRVPAGDRAPFEPVTVLAVDEDGTRHRLRWLGREPRATLRYAADTPIDWAWVDPDARIEQSDLFAPDRHPRFDDRDRHPLRFVYNSFGVLLNVSDLSALLAADFSLSRVHDLRNQMRFLAFTSASVRAGGLVSYRRLFGPRAQPDRLLGRASIAVGASRLDEDFFNAEGEPPRGATQLSLVAWLGRDTELFRYEPLAKHDARLVATLTATRRDDVLVAPADWLVSGDVGAWTSRTTTPQPGHTIAGELGVDVAFGDIESRAQLVAPGGATGLRGFSPGALFARGAVVARGEYRHTFVHDLDWNLGHYTFVRGAGGVAFFDVGLLSPCSDLVPGGRDEVVFTAAGYGLQLVYDSFGTLPSVSRIDAAIRLGGRTSDCLGAPIDEGAQVQVYVSFVPPF
ncbi:MAG TPA: hypothetical protein VMZ28_07655 [Kofleriaceae bacterium]|nr:hypothetical protein [Kofleriaceae bacterium]